MFTFPTFSRHRDNAGNYNIFSWRTRIALYCMVNTLQWRHNGRGRSQITSLTIVSSTIDSDADQRKHQSSASLAFVRGIHRGAMNSSHKWPVTRNFFSIWWRHHDNDCRGHGDAKNPRINIHGIRLVFHEYIGCSRRRVKWSWIFVPEITRYTCSN